MRQYVYYLCVHTNSNKMDDFYSLGFLLNRASVSVAKAMKDSLAAHQIDLTHPQFNVLRCLYFKDGLSQFEIANLLFKDAAAIKRTVDFLEQKGLVVRKQVRTLKNSVCLTDKGWDLIPQAMKIGESILNKVIEGIGSKNYSLLRTMLDKIYTNLETE